MSIRDNLDISAYLVLGPENTLGRPVGDVVAQALDAGFTCIQVRSKVASAREIIALTGDAAQAIAQAGKTGQVALLIDDRLDCVLAAREQGIAVDGVHVGQSDIPVEVCRKLLGPDAIVGLSARCEEMLEYVKTADMSLVDYLGIGPLHETETKRDCGRAADGSIITKSFEDLAALHAASPVPIVVGGGNVAIDVARNACRLGSEHVEMFCLESEAQMPASEEERREAIEDGAHISCGWGPKEIHLDEAGRVCGITFKRCTRVYDDEGRFTPEYDENDLRRVDADRVVMSIGQSIVWGDLLAGSKVELGRGQGALADPQTYQTAEPDIFVGGDVYTGPSFAIDAIAAGHEAAVSIHRFVQPGSTLTIGRNQRRYTALDRDDVVIESYDNASREVAHVDREREKAAPFSEYVETFTEEQIRAETARCLGCGASIVDPNKCIGCGLCTTKCAFDAIHLDRDRPECSTMVKYEQKLPSLGKYALKRAIKIKFGKK